MLILNGVVKDHDGLLRLRHEVGECRRRGAQHGVILPRRIHAELSKSMQGEGGWLQEYYVTVPYVFLSNERRFRWCVAHELGHVMQAKEGSMGSLRHDARFYLFLRALCDPSAIREELRYRPSARRHLRSGSSFRKL